MVLLPEWHATEREKTMEGCSVLLPQACKIKYDVLTISSVPAPLLPGSAGPSTKTGDMLADIPEPLTYTDGTEQPPLPHPSPTPLIVIFQLSAHPLGHRICERRVNTPPEGGAKSGTEGQTGGRRVRTRRREGGKRAFPDGRRTEGGGFGLGGWVF
jgi:hypothetical protein